jgi:hypothetical protein
MIAYWASDAWCFEVSRSIALGQVIDDILLIAEASNHGEWEGLIRYFPLR